MLKNGETYEDGVDGAEMQEPSDIGLRLVITPEGVEFKEFEIGDALFFNNRFWEKVEDRKAKIIHSTFPEEVGIVKQFTGNCTVKIVLDKNN